MNREQRQVLDFHQAMHCAWQQRPGDIPYEQADLRLDLIQEECAELGKAIEESDLVGIADALADLLYVVYGCGLAYGIDLEPIFAEVHRSNMTKAGGQTRADGKIGKGPHYQPPQLQAILDRLSERSISE